MKRKGEDKGDSVGDLLGAKGIATSNKGIATRSKGLTTRNKKLLGTISY